MMMFHNSAYKTSLELSYKHHNAYIIPVEKLHLFDTATLGISEEVRSNLGSK